MILRTAQYLNTARLLFGEPQSITERIVAVLCAMGTYGIAIGTILWMISGVSTGDGVHFSLFQRVAIAVVSVSAVTFILTLCVGGMLAVGRQAGKRNPLVQLLYTFGRACLFVLVPCAVLTLIILLVAFLMGYLR
ncbi:MAG TPA: hypothetical protein VFT53_06100 [Candidatus Saccharimonadales bacterium]|nr:hypothetical protein [Candidatus Saccharimonadales bacterium]